MVAGKTYLYTYDNAGNITSKKTYPYTIASTASVASKTPTATYTYTYEDENWGDRLSSYRGVSFTYDSLGNPTSYYNGSSYTMGWSKGRQLSMITKSSSYFGFTYDAEGRRTSKLSFSGRVIEYLWDGNLLIGEYVAGQETITYSYDASGSPVGFTYTDLTGYYEGGVPCSFLYRKNPQGDIIGIVDSSGNEFVKYNYDAWGNLISYTMHGDNLYSLHYNLAEENPFRYRGYYYDRETGFYYLNSRYYDPAIGRFINADGYVGTGTGLLGYNMYAYCNNNPVLYVDHTGKVFTLCFAIGLSIGVFIGSMFADEIDYAIQSTIGSSDYDHNSQYIGTEKDSQLIDYQALYSEYEYGAGCTMDYNGCEVIAVHNALILSGRTSSLACTAAVFSMKRAMMLLGLWGSNPHKIGDVLTGMDVKYTKIDSLDYMDKDGVYIISYWVDNSVFEGIHTIAVERKDGKFNSWNPYREDTSLSFAKEGFICGYYWR